MKKRILALFLCAVTCCLLLVACGGSKDGDNSGAGNSGNGGSSASDAPTTNSNPTMDNITLPFDPATKVKDAWEMSADDVVKKYGVEESSEDVYRGDGKINGEGCTLTFIFDDGKLIDIKYDFDYVMGESKEDKQARYDKAVAFFDGMYGSDNRSIDKEDYVSYAFDYNGEKLCLSIVSNQDISGSIFIV